MSQGGELAMDRVLRLTFAVIGRNVPGVVGLALLTSLVGVGVNVAVGHGVGLMGHGVEHGVEHGEVYDGSDAIAPAVGRFAARLVGAVGGAMLAVVAVGGISGAAIDDLSGRRAGLGAAWRTGVRLAAPLYGLGVVMAIGIGVGSALFLVPGLVLAVRWAVAVPVRVAEGVGIGACLSRSAALTAGQGWPLFGLLVAGFVGVLVVEALQLLSATMGLVTALGVEVATLTAVLVLGATGMAVCYVELRRLRESGGAGGGLGEG